jgi:hypothetical protein
MTHDERMKFFRIDTNSPAYKAGQKLAERKPKAEHIRSDQNIVTPSLVADLEAGDRPGWRLVARKFERINGKWFVTDTVEPDSD